MSNPGADINLEELLKSLWARRLLLAGITAAGSLLALAIVLLLPNVYRAEALLAPRRSEVAAQSHAASVRNFRCLLACRKAGCR